MHSIILADEDAFAKASWVEAVNARLDGIPSNERTICFAGSKDFVEIAAETVGAARVTYLGPVISDYQPLWWWGWMDAVGKNVYRDCLLVGALNSSTVPPEAVHLFASKSYDVFHLWAQLIDAQGEHAARLARELAAALTRKTAPPAAAQIVRHMTAYFRAFAEYWNRLLISPNPMSWTDVAAGSTLGRRVAVDVAQSVKDLETAIADLRSAGVAFPRFPPPILSKVTDRVPPHLPRNASDLVDRARVWSGLLYGRAELLRADGRPVESFANAWRSLEAYATSLGLLTSVLDIDRARGCRLRWGSGMTTPSGDVTVKKLFDELLARGSFVTHVPAVAHLSFDHVRDIRNDSIYGHGYLGIEPALLNDVMTFVAEVIRVVEGPSKLWEASRQTAFTKLTLIEVPMALGDVLD